MFSTYAHIPSDNPVTQEECKSLATMLPELQALAGQLLNYGWYMVSDPRNPNIRKKVNKLRDDASQAKASNNDLAYFRAVSEISQAISGHPSIPQEVLDKYDTLWQSYSTLYNRCSTLPPLDSSVPEAPSKKDDVTKPDNKRECPNNPAKWGVRFIYKEYKDCQGQVPNTSVTGSSSDGIDIGASLVSDNPLITWKEEEPLTATTNRTFTPATDNQLQTTVSTRPRPTLPPRTSDPFATGLTIGSAFDTIDPSKLGGSAGDLVQGALSSLNSQMSQASITNTQIGKAGDQILSDTLLKTGQVSSMNPLKEWYLTLLPAIQSTLPKQGARDVPNSMPGVQFRAANRVVKHHVPGMGPIYQNLGVDSLFITFVGTFTGDGGLSNPSMSNPFDAFARPSAPLEVAEQAAQSSALSAKTSALTRYSLYGMDDTLFLQDGCPGQCPPPGNNPRGRPIQTSFIDAEWEDVPSNGKKTLGDIAGELDAYKEFTSFYKMAYSEGRHLEIEINMRRNRDGLVIKGNPQDPNYKDPLREAGGNPKFKGYIRRVESYLQYSDRMWYLIEVEVTDHGDVTDKPLNLTNEVGKDEPPAPTPEASVQDNPELACLLAKGLMQGVKSTINIGSGKFLYVFANGQGVIARGDLKKENVESVITPGDALSRAILHLQPGEEAAFYKGFKQAVSINQSVAPPSQLQTTQTMTYQIYTDLGWTKYRYGEDKKLYQDPESQAVYRYGVDTYLYIHPSNHAFIGPEPDKLEVAFKQGVPIINPQNLMDSYLLNLQGDDLWKAMRQYVSNTDIQTKSPCTETVKETTTPGAVGSSATQQQIIESQTPINPYNGALINPNSVDPSRGFAQHQLLEPGSRTPWGVRR